MVKHDFNNCLQVLIILQAKMEKGLKITANDKEAFRSAIEGLKEYKNVKEKERN